MFATDTFPHLVINGKVALYIFAADDTNLLRGLRLKDGNTFGKTSHAIVLVVKSMSDVKTFVATSSRLKDTQPRNWARWHHSISKSMSRTRQIFDAGVRQSWLREEHRQPLSLQVPVARSVPDLYLT